MRVASEGASEGSFTLNITETVVLRHHGLWTLTMCNKVGCTVGYVFALIKGMCAYIEISAQKLLANITHGWIFL